MLAGMVPLLPLFFGSWLASPQMFAYSAVLTALTFFVIGWIRGAISERQPLLAGIETLFVGGSAAVLAYVIGALLRDYAVG